MVQRVQNNDIENKAYVNIDLSKRGEASADLVKQNLSDAIAEKSKELDLLTGSDSDEKALNINKQKADSALKAAQKDLEAFNSNPELYSQLYSLKNDTNNYITSDDLTDENAKHSQPAQANIAQDANGNLFLAVDLLKPSMVGFQIHDGKIVFSGDGLDATKMKEIFAYLEHRGLGHLVNLDDIKIENADKKTEEMFEQVKDQVQEEINAAGNKETFYSSEAVNDDELDENSANTQQTDQVQEQTEETPTPKKEKKDKKSDPEQDRKDAIKSLRKWFDKNKRFGLTYFEDYSDGYMVFSSFEKENPENPEKDGLIDKNGDIKVRNEFKVYVRINPKSGNLEVSFSVPAGKILTDFQAERILEAHQEAGKSHVKFGRIDDASEGSIRIACGKTMIVPVGLKLSKTKIEKMISSAEEKNGKNNPKVTRYKYDLAMQHARNLKAKGIDWQAPNKQNDSECRCIRHMIGNYRFAPFRDLWEDFDLRGTVEAEISKNDRDNCKDGASGTIGAVMAVSALYRVYAEASKDDLSVKDLLSDKCTKLSLSEKEKFAKLIPAEEMNVDVRNMNPALFIELYNIMKVTQTAKAKKDIDEEFVTIQANRSDTGESKEQRAIKRYMVNAQKKLKNVNEELKDVGLDPIFLPEIGETEHNFDDARKKIKEKNDNEDALNPRRNQGSDQDNQGSRPNRGPKPNQGTGQRMPNKDHVY